MFVLTQPTRLIQSNFENKDLITEGSTPNTSAIYVCICFQHTCIVSSNPIKYVKLIVNTHFKRAAIESLLLRSTTSQVLVDKTVGVRVYRL